MQAPTLLLALSLLAAVAAVAAAVSTEELMAEAEALVADHERLRGAVHACPGGTCSDAAALVCVRGARHDIDADLSLPTAAQPRLGPTDELARLGKEGRPFHESTTSASARPTALLPGPWDGKA